MAVVNVQQAVQPILGAMLDYLSLLVTIVLLYMLVRLGIGTYDKARERFGRDGGRDGGGRRERPPRTPKEGAERPLPPGVVQHLQHRWDAPQQRYLLHWEARPGDENVVEYRIQRRESPSLRNFFSRRLLVANMFGGWQTIGRSTASEFADTGTTHRWAVNPRNLTYPGNRRLHPNLAYEYRVRAVNNQNQSGPWAYSRPEAAPEQAYEVHPEIRGVAPAGPLHPFVPVPTHVQGAVVVDAGNPAVARFRLDWWAFPLAEQAFAQNMVATNAAPDQAPTHHGVLHRSVQAGAPSLDQALLPLLDYATLTGHIVCLGLLDPATNEWRWDSRAIAPHHPIIIIPAMIRGGQPVIAVP
jgi:hypothetical protein